MATEKLVKLKSRVGNHEIEIEGPRSDVEQLMKAWWLSVAADTGQPQRRTSESDIKAVSKKSRLSSRTPNEDSAESENNGGIDPHRIAMAMKEDSRSALFEKKILHGLDNWQKIALVLWYVDQPLTSGQIQKILDSLDVKISLPNLSTVLKRKSTFLISSQQRRLGGKPPTYRLTSKAKSDFTSWLGE